MAHNDLGEKKRKQLSSNSTGNQHKFNQQIPKKPKEKSNELSVKENLRDIEIVNELDSLSHCCAIGGDLGCCLKHFINEENNLPDYDKALQYVKDNRIISKDRYSHEIRDPMIISIFKSSIKNDTIRGGERVFEMDYRMPSPNNLFGRDNTVKCCRKALWVIYGITEYEWRLASSTFKEVPFGQNVSSLHHKAYNDKTLHNYTYAEAEQVFNDNLGYAGNSSINNQFSVLNYNIILYNNPLSLLVVKLIMNINNNRFFNGAQLSSSFCGDTKAGG